MDNTNWYKIWWPLIFGGGGIIGVIMSIFTIIPIINNFGQENKKPVFSVSIHDSITAPKLSVDELQGVVLPIFIDHWRDEIERYPDLGMYDLLQSQLEMFEYPIEMEKVQVSIVVKNSGTLQADNAVIALKSKYEINCDTVMLNLTGSVQHECLPTSIILPPIRMTENDAVTITYALLFASGGEFDRVFSIVAEDIMNLDTYDVIETPTQIGEITVAADGVSITSQRIMCCQEKDKDESQPPSHDGGVRIWVFGLVIIAVVVLILIMRRVYPWFIYRNWKSY
ncbi:MAG: hypothetical protein DWQ07_25985 [Chloroflexi bacterium]|nr:MAG: hypothetical protein DWQ07_25985 [Chloroflexota bacterium]